MILYKIGGLGADERVFEKIILNSLTISINWIETGFKETVRDYTVRISEKIDRS